MTRFISILIALCALSFATTAHAAKKIKLVDNCSDVAPTSLVVGDVVQATGTTAGKANDFTTSGGWLCGDPAPGVAPDVVAGLVLTQAGVLDVQVSAAGFVPALYVRSSCGTEALCFEPGSGGSVHMAQHLEAGPVFLVIDGDVSKGGPFALAVSFTADICGDGVVSPGEACDDGNTIDGDGCSSACALEPAGAGDTCPGEAIAIGPGTTLVSGWSYGYADDTASKSYLLGGCGYEAGGPDHVYAVTTTTTGTLTATVGVEPDGVTSACADTTAPECWDAAIYARASCADAATEIACSDQGAVAPETIVLPVASGSTYYVIVDGYNAATSGAYTLALTIQ